MKKILLLFNFFLTIFSLFQNAAISQTVLASADFNSYLGTIGSAPNGWHISEHSNIIGNSTFYSTTNSSGLSPNSYRFKTSGAFIVTSSFANADSMYFWLKGNSTDSLSYLLVLESADSVNWDTIQHIIPLPASGTNYSYGVQPTSIYIKFEWYKSAGNLSFDDVSVINSTLTGIKSHRINADNISIYPNPSRGITYLNLPAHDKFKISIYNILGKELKESFIKKISESKYEINLEKEVTGIYFIKLTSSSNSIVKRLYINR